MRACNGDLIAFAEGRVADCSDATQAIPVLALVVRERIDGRSVLRQSASTLPDVEGPDVDIAIDVRVLGPDQQIQGAVAREVVEANALARPPTELVAAGRVAGYEVLVRAQPMINSLCTLSCIAQKLFFN